MFRSFRRCFSADYSPTIFALSTRPGRAAIAVVRVSGSQSAHILQRLTRVPPLAPAPPRLEPRRASVRRLYSPHAPHPLLDEALTLFFQSPRSYTGEDSLELHLHGGTAIVSAVVSAINALHDPAHGVNIRYAEPGEFSRRAFANGRFDLTEIEGVRDMIDAETELQRRAAVAAMLGGSRRQFAEWRLQIVHNVALLTTVIDFGEDHDVAEVDHLLDQVGHNIAALSAAVDQHLHHVAASEVLLRGIKLVLLGPPNAGKSLLLNRIARSDAAIVSSTAGTTRDVIDVPLDIGGYKVVIGDTAGVRAAVAGSIEAEGIRRAKLRSVAADVVVLVLPANEPAVDADLARHVAELRAADKLVVVVHNKADLVPARGSDSLYVLCATGEGIDALVAHLTALFASLIPSTDPVLLSARAQDLLRNDVLYGFAQFERFRHQNDVVLATESLRQAADGIGKITGDAVGVEEVLGVVFSSFCIGK